MGAAARWMMRKSASAGRDARQTSLLPSPPSLQPSLPSLAAGANFSVLLLPPSELLLQRSRVRMEVLKAAGQRRWLEGLQVPPRATNSSLQQ